MPRAYICQQSGEISQDDVEGRAEGRGEDCGWKEGLSRGSYTNFPAPKVRASWVHHEKPFLGFGVSRHLNAPRTPLPGLVSPPLFLSYFRVSSCECPSDVFRKRGERVTRACVYVCKCARDCRTLAIREFPVYSRSTFAFVLLSTVGHPSRLMGWPAASSHALASSSGSYLEN